VSDLPTKKKHGGLNTSSARLYSERIECLKTLWAALPT